MLGNKGAETCEFLVKVLRLDNLHLNSNFGQNVSSFILIHSFVNKDDTALIGSGGLWRRGGEGWKSSSALLNSSWATALHPIG